MNELILALMVGVSGSGKSTYADTLIGPLNAVKIETDAIRFELTGNASDQSKNGLVFGIAKKRIRENLSSGKNVIFDATNLSVKDRREFIELGKEYGSKIHAYVVKPDLVVSKQRNALRERQVPEFVIDKQHAKFVMPTESENIDYIQSV